MAILEVAQEGVPPRVAEKILEGVIVTLRLAWLKLLQLWLWPKRKLPEISPKQKSAIAEAEASAAGGSDNFCEVRKVMLQLLKVKAAAAVARAEAEIAR